MRVLVDNDSRGQWQYIELVQVNVLNYGLQQGEVPEVQLRWDMCIPRSCGSDDVRSVADLGI